MRTFIIVFAIALGSCRHDFTLVDKQPDGPLTLTPLGFGTDVMHQGADVVVFGGFSAGKVTCPATGLCVQGGLHP